MLPSPAPQSFSHFSQQQPVPPGPAQSEPLGAQPPHTAIRKHSPLTHWVTGPQETHSTQDPILITDHREGFVQFGHTLNGDVEFFCVGISLRSF